MELLPQHLLPLKAIARITARQTSQTYGEDCVYSKLTIRDVPETKQDRS